MSADPGRRQTGQQPARRYPSTDFAGARDDLPSAPDVLCARRVAGSGSTRNVALQDQVKDALLDKHNDAVAPADAAVLHGATRIAPERVAPHALRHGSLTKPLPLVQALPAGDHAGLNQRAPPGVRRPAAQSHTAERPFRQP